MQKSLNLLSIGACVGLAVLFGTMFHHYSHGTPTIPVTAKTTVTHAPITAESYGRLPLSFERNEGQVDKQVAFLSHGPGYNLFLTANQAVISLHTSGFGVRGSGIENDYRRHFTNHKHVARDSWLVARGQVPEHLTNHKPRTTNHDAVLRLKLLGANEHPQISGVGELPGIVNYFIGNDPKKWRIHVPTYSRIAYKQVYPGIDMVYYGNQKQLEYDWVVAPGADVHIIQIGVKGAEKVTLTAQGDLQLHTGSGDVIQHAPIAYQEIDGTRKPVSSGLVLLASSSGTTEKRIGFEVGAYDHAHPLVVDPVLVYSTYLGGSGDEEGVDIAVDSVGNAYVVGHTTSVDFPMEVPLQSTLKGSMNGFVTAINASGTALIYSTYLGGSGNDEAYRIAVDSSDNVFITGQTTSPDFPTHNPYQSSNHSSTGNAFVTKLNSTGSALIYSTYLGGSGTAGNANGDGGGGIAVDSSGNAYVTGLTTSTDFPTHNPFQSTNHSTILSSNGSNAFITKLNSTGSSLVYSTYLGGSGTAGNMQQDGPAVSGEIGGGIALDSSGNAYITGYTTSTDFPTHNPFQSTNHSTILSSTGSNAFITKINSTGTALIYSTYLGGSGGGKSSGIAVDSAGNAYITGQTTSTDFPTVGSPVLQSQKLGSTTAFITSLNATGSAINYSTYLGGSDYDYGQNIAVDSSGNAYVSGGTNSIDFPVLYPIQKSFRGNDGDNAFIAKVNRGGTALLYSTYLGGSSLGGSSSAEDWGEGIAVDGYGNAYATGHASSDDFPVQNPLQSTNHSVSSSNGNAFVVRIGNYNWQTVDVTVGSDNLARLLWINTNFTVGLWSVNNSGQASSLNNIGPFTGYTDQATAAGADGLTRMLWNKTDGTAALWLLNANNTEKSGFNFGPYTGWTAVDVAVGSDNKTRMLWTKSDGTAGVWTVDNSGNLSNLTNIGPYTGWTASRIAAGSDGYTRLLWTKNDGTVGVWLLNANNTYKSGFNFGPYTSWRGIDIAVGSDNKTRLLWNKSDGTAGVWTVDNNGVSTNLTNVGPYTGWIATKIASGADGYSRMLWFKGDGTQGLWLLNANNSFINGFNFGPY